MNRIFEEELVKNDLQEDTSFIENSGNFSKSESFFLTYNLYLSPPTYNYSYTVPQKMLYFDKHKHFVKNKYHSE